jgi:hypothetical protein
MDTVSTNHPHYAAFSRDMHAEVTSSNKLQVLSRNNNGKLYKVSQPLESGSIIWNKINRVINHYKKEIIKDDKHFFLKEFEATLENQKYHFNNCLHEVYVSVGNCFCKTASSASITSLDAPMVVQECTCLERRHYVEGRKDGKMMLARGTNRNESAHQR